MKTETYQITERKGQQGGWITYDITAPSKAAMDEAIADFNQRWLVYDATIGEVKGDEASGFTATARRWYKQ